MSRRWGSHKRLLSGTMLAWKYCCHVRNRVTIIVVLTASGFALKIFVVSSKRTPAQKKNMNRYLNRYFKIWRRTLVVVHLAIVLVCLSGSVFAQSSNRAEEKWSGVFYAGVMTTNTVDELVSSFDYADNNLIGYAIAYDRPFSDSKWSVGSELQFTYHFGGQQYAEIGLPVTIRYRPEEPWFAPVESFSFGLGMSYTTEVPVIEVETRGDSRKSLIYWMLEAEFNTPLPETRWFMRIHHRSDAWGVLYPNGGSNALVLGLRHDF